MPALTVTIHDGLPPDESALVDRGLGESNALAAPLHEVHPISCFVRSVSGQVLGGAIGRWWGQACELQQLWVEPAHRRQGIGTKLINAFEAHALSHGCQLVYLETFNFQAPSLYRSLGYNAEYEHKGYPHGIVKFHMVKHVALGASAA